MTECEYCGDEVEEPHECGECGDTFCYVHSAPEHHKCPELGAENSGEVTCDHCGTATEDPEKCPDCGGVYCENHTGPITHDCPNYERPTTSSTAGSLAEVEADDGSGLLSGTIPGGKVPVVVVAGLLVIGLGTGVLGPGLVSGMFGGGAADAPDATSTPTPTEPAPFDEQQYRQAVFDWVNEQRTVDDLSVNETRQEVLEGVAEDMARYGWPNNDSDRAVASWNITRQLEQGGATCVVNDSGVDVSAVLFSVPYGGTTQNGARINSTADLVEWTTQSLNARPGMREVFSLREVETQAMGVYKQDPQGAPDGQPPFVYVVYVSC